MYKIAIISTHPIQYYAPVFQRLARNSKLNIRVFFTWGSDSIKKFDPGFNRVIEWDVPLLEGYDYTFLPNNAKDPGSHHFFGISNPTAIKEINQYNPNAILVFGWAYRSHLAIILHFSKRKNLWFRGDSTLLDPAGNLKKLGRFLLLQWVYSHFDKIFYVGKNNLDYFRRFGVPKKKLIFAPHAVANERFSQAKESDAFKIRSTLKIDQRCIVILFAGKFEEKKDPLLLLEAFINLKDHRLHLLFAGNGDLEKEMRKLASSSELSKRISFIDFQNQSSMPALYKACDIFCLPSKGPGETWGLAINEAMAVGRAVIASNRTGCAADLIIEGSNGCIFKAGDVNDLRIKLSYMIKDMNYIRMGKRSAEVIKYWSINETEKAIVKVIEDED